MTLGLVLSILISGFFTGALARLAIPGPDPMPIWLTIAIGLVGSIMGWFVLPPTGDLADTARFDWKGALLLAPALTALVTLLNEGYAWGATAPLFGLAVLALALVALFVRAERRATAPLIDSAGLRSRQAISPDFSPTRRCSGCSS